MKRSFAKWNDVLINVGSILDSFGIQYFLDSGTLLGAVREKNFLKWDNDIDIGVLCNFVNPNKLICLCDELERQNFIVHRYKYAIYIDKDEVQVGIMLYSLNEIEGFYSATLISYKHPKLSLFISVLDETLISIYGNTYKIRIKTKVVNIIKHIKVFFPKTLDLRLKKLAQYTYKKMVVPVKLFTKMTTIDFLGAKYFCPVIPDYLIHRYGASWETPKKKWDYINDDKSLV